MTGWIIISDRVAYDRMTVERRQMRHLQGVPGVHPVEGPGLEARNGRVLTQHVAQPPPLQLHRVVYRPVGLQGPTSR